MSRLVAALALACALTLPADAGRRHRHAFCTPVFIEGAGTVWICPPRRWR